MTDQARYPSLADRTVLITGGATGIGATLVEQFLMQGAKVGFVDIVEAAGKALAIPPKLRYSMLRSALA